MESCKQKNVVFSTILGHQRAPPLSSLQKHFRRKLLPLSRHASYLTALLIVRHFSFIFLLFSFPSLLPLLVLSFLAFLVFFFSFFSFFVFLFSIFFRFVLFSFLSFIFCYFLCFFSPIDLRLSCVCLVIDTTCEGWQAVEWVSPVVSNETYAQVWTWHIVD